MCHCLPMQATGDTHYTRGRLRRISSSCLLIWEPGWLNTTAKTGWRVECKCLLRTRGKKVTDFIASPWTDGRRPGTYGPKYDGDTVQKWASSSMRQSRITGTNTASCWKGAVTFRAFRQPGLCNLPSKRHALPAYVP